MIKINLLKVLIISLASCLHAEDVGVREELTDPNFENIMRIVGGTPLTKITEIYPWFASYYIHDGAKWRSCGGMLIAPEYGE